METASLLKERVDGDLNAPRRILFVCTGNTCRSPMAAALMNDMSRLREICSANDDPAGTLWFVASSAGLYAGEGDPITPEAAQALTEQGIVSRPGNDYLAHRARQISEEMVDEADEVVGLTASHAMQLMLRFPEAASKIRTLPMDIPDPFGGSAQVYRDTLARLQYAIELAYFTEVSS